MQIENRLQFASTLDNKRENNLYGILKQQQKKSDQQNGKKSDQQKKQIENKQQMLCNNRPKGSLFVGIANAGNCNVNKELETALITKNIVNEFSSHFINESFTNRRVNDSIFQ